MHFKIICGTNVHIGFDTLYTKLSLVCCSIIMLLGLSYLYKIFFERSKPRKVRHEFLNQKHSFFFKGMGGGRGITFGIFQYCSTFFGCAALQSHLYMINIPHTICQWAFNSFRLFEHYHSLYNVTIFKWHQLSFTQIISIRKVQILMFVLWMNNTYLIFFKIKLEEVYETPTQFFMVLELVTGGELFDRSVFG